MKYTIYNLNEDKKETTFKYFKRWIWKSHNMIFFCNFKENFKYSQMMKISLK